MHARRPLAIATIVLLVLAGILQCWEARAQQLLPVPDHAFFGHDFKKYGLSGPLGSYRGGLPVDDWGYRQRLDVCNNTTSGNLTGTYCAVWETKIVASDQGRPVHSPCSNVSSEAQCICREASGNRRYCSAWLCMKQAPVSVLEGIGDAIAHNNAEGMAAVRNGSLQIKGCQCTKEALNGNFCVMWECIEYNAGRVQAHGRFVCDTAYNQAQGASGQASPTSPWGDYTALKAAAPSDLLDQTSNSSIFCAAWTGWIESDLVHEEHKCTCQGPSDSQAYCNISICHHRHRSVVVPYLFYFLWALVICFSGVCLVIAFELYNTPQDSDQPEQRFPPCQLQWMQTVIVLLFGIRSVIMGSHSAADGQDKGVGAHIGIVVAVHAGGLLLLHCFRGTRVMGYLAILVCIGGLTVVIAGILGLLIWVGIYMWITILMYDVKGNASLSVSPEAPAVLPTSLARNSFAVELPVPDSSRDRSNDALHDERSCCAVMGKVMDRIMAWVLQPIAIAIAIVPCLPFVFVWSCWAGCCAGVTSESHGDGGGGGGDGGGNGGGGDGGGCG
eukprot:jgi/Chrzof1/1118/Cz01g40220.t1